MHLHGAPTLSAKNAALTAVDMSVLATTEETATLQNTPGCFDIQRMGTLLRAGIKLTVSKSCPEPGLEFNKIKSHITISINFQRFMPLYSFKDQAST